MELCNKVGSAPITLAGQSTFLSAPSRERGRKPDEFYRLVESLCPGAKLDLYARESRRGWTSWGAEATKFDEAPLAAGGTRRT
jgi:N6-adenosine-specific RNA methylase IME4